MVSKNILLTFAVILLVVALVLMFVLPYIIRRNTETPDYERKWTDPKNHQ